MVAFRAMDRMAARPALSGMIVRGVIIVAALVLVIVALNPREKGNPAAAHGAAAARLVRAIAADEAKYRALYPSLGYAPSLSVLGSCAGKPTAQYACLTLIDPSCSTARSGEWCTDGQYKYSIVGIGCNSNSPCADFVLSAAPVNPQSGTSILCVTSDGEVHFRQGKELPDPIALPKECHSWPLQ
jgi:hypothetical protein